ncbi:hypothetical protein TNCV_3208381 [Trichonephila clavipes]|nr:hypothetical protein TNCV_3208381 [Trichonephila clavipes]
MRYSSSCHTRLNMVLKEGRFDLCTFRSVRKYFIDHAKTMVFALCLVLVYIDITPPHTPMPVIRRIGERTMPYSCTCHQRTWSLTQDQVYIPFLARDTTEQHEGIIRAVNNTMLSRVWQELEYRIDVCRV